MLRFRRIFNLRPVRFVRAPAFSRAVSNLHDSSDAKTSEVEKSANKKGDFSLWKELDNRDEAERVKLAAFLAEFADMANARDSMVESPDQLEGGGLALHDHLTPTAVRRMIEYLRTTRGKIAVKTFKNILHQGLVRLSNCSNISLVPKPGPGEKVSVIGDIHGDLDDLLKIIDLIGMPGSDNHIIFNGDFVDRGRHGVEVLAVLLAMKIVYPKYVHLNRGNHEDSSICRAYGFYDEVMAKYSSPRLYERITELFSVIPLCAVIRDQAFIVHGGIPRNDGVTLQHIGAIARRTHKQTFCTHAEGGRAGTQTSRQVIEDMMWSDPDAYATGQAVTTSRGAGCRFGPDAVKRWLEKFDSPTMKTLVRSHEVVENGYETIDCGDGYKIWTVFSASHYAGGWNQGAILQFEHGKDDPTPLQFETSYSGPGGAYKKDTQTTKIGEIILKYQADLERAFEKIADESGQITKRQWESTMYSELGLQLEFKKFAVPYGEAPENGKIGWREFLERYREEMAEDNPLHYGLSAVFGILDENGDGIVTNEEFKKGCKLLNHRLPKEQQFDGDALFAMLDKDNSGFVEIDEVRKAVGR